MRLAELVMHEACVSADEIMLLRHGNDSVALLQRYGATVEDFTSIQPIGSKYDYYHPHRPRIAIVVVIVEDHIYGLYRVEGVEAEGTNYSLASAAYQEFESARKRLERRCRRFHLLPMTSILTGLPVAGWERRTRIPVQRSDGKFFNDVHVLVTSQVGFGEAVEQSFQAQVAKSLRDTSNARMKRLAIVERIPRRVEITTSVFARNADVVAEILFRAGGCCQLCCSPAPFKRSNGAPYLEVHHKKPLAEGGEDAVENAIALCPNCHRKAHYA